MVSTNNYTGGYQAAFETLWDIIISFNEHNERYEGELRCEIEYDYKDAENIFIPLHMLTLYYDDVELLAIDYVMDQTYGLDISDEELHRILSLLIVNCTRHICMYGLEGIVNQAILNDVSYSYAICESEKKF